MESVDDPLPLELSPVIRDGERRVDGLGITGVGLWTVLAPARNYTFPALFPTGFPHPGRELSPRAVRLWKTVDVARLTELQGCNYTAVERAVESARVGKGAPAYRIRARFFTSCVSSWISS